MRRVSARRLAAGLIGVGLIAAGPLPARPLWLAAQGNTSPGPGGAAVELRVHVSPGFAAAQELLAVEFERLHGVQVITERAPSTGAVQTRLTRGDPADVAILAVDGMEALVEGGAVLADSRTRLGSTGVGIAVPADRPAPDVSSLEALRRALQEARSVAYSAGPSGAHVAEAVLPRLGLADEVSAKSVRTSDIPGALARGEADFGFQQMSELISIEGIRYVGPLPAELQSRTAYDAAVVTGSNHPEAARALIDFLASPGADEVVLRMGLER
jgi:molybdate transport system substrate-binding protein